MKKLMIAMSVAGAIAFGASADIWFGNSLNGDWNWEAPPAGWAGATVDNVWNTDDGALTVDNSETPLSYTASPSKTLGTDAKSVTITTTAKFTVFDADDLPAVPADAKAGVIMVNFEEGFVVPYVLSMPDKVASDNTNTWVATEGVMYQADDLSANITIETKLWTDTRDGVKQMASYKFYGSSLIGDEPEPVDIRIAQFTTGISKVAYQGSGAVASLSGAYEEMSGGDVPVTGIEITASTNEIVVGSSLQLAATVTPDNATDKSVTWSVESGSGSIDQTGLYSSGATTGGVVIKAAANDGSNVYGTFTITIVAAPEPARPDALSGCGTETKNAYDTWAANNGVTGQTDAGLVNAFILNQVATMSLEDLKKVLDSEITAQMVADLAAGKDPDLSALAAKYPYATFSFVACTELPDVVGVSKFRRLQATLRVDNQ